MHELTDDVRHFIYKQKDELGKDLYLSIRNKLGYMYRKGEINLNDKFQDTAYKFTIDYIKDMKQDKLVDFDNFEEQRNYFKKLLKIATFCMFDINSKEKGVKYAWMTRKKQQYI